MAASVSELSKRAREGDARVSIEGDDDAIAPVS